MSTPGWRRQSSEFSSDPERGAALLLVLLLIPALTIVGAAFLKMAIVEGDRTRAQEQQAQALYYAEGGVARANWALIAKGKLDKVSVSMPTGVTACTANQGGVTSGSVNWSGANVSFSATGTSGPYSRKVSGQFDVASDKVNLKNVITTPGLIDFKKDCTINGPVVTGDPSTNLSGFSGVHPVTVATVKLLDVPSAITGILAAYTETVVTSAQINPTSVASPYVFDGSAGTAVYYTNDPGLWVSNAGGGNKCVSVKGECIWCIANGASFGKEFTFLPVGPNPKLLLLISGCSGMDVQKSMDAVGVSLVLVSDGNLSFKKQCNFPDIAMYGAAVDGDKGQVLTYDPTLLDSWIDSLDSRNLLPSVLNAANGITTKVTGTWAEVP